MLNKYVVTRETDYDRYLRGEAFGFYLPLFHSDMDAAAKELKELRAAMPEVKWIVVILTVQKMDL